MDKQEKRRLYIIVVIIIIAVILLFLSKRAQGIMNTIVNQGGISLPELSDGFGLSDLPGLNYTPGDYRSETSNIGGSKGCALCFSGYSRIEVVSTPAPEPVMATKTQLITMPRYSSGGVWATSAPTPAPTSFWNVTGRFF